MEQVFEHYNKWEDHKAGMYRTSSVTGKAKMAIGAINILSDADLFYNTCLSVLKDWPVSSAVNLTNKSQNRRAWLGAAACCYSAGVPEFITRIAWGLLDADVQYKANLVADKIILKYERENSELHKVVGEPMLF